MRKQILTAVITGTLVLSSTNAYAMPFKKFKNCTSLKKKYPGGVAKSTTSRNTGGAIKKTPKVNKKVYNENKGLDRDKDGIACEN